MRPEYVNNQYRRWPAWVVFVSYFTLPFPSWVGQEGGALRGGSGARASLGGYVIFTMRGGGAGGYQKTK